MDPLKTYDYLTKAREQVLDAASALAPEQYRQSFRFGLGSIASTLTHMMITEWAYSQRIQGRELPPYEQWPIQDENPPPFEVVARTWREQAPQTRRILEEVHRSEDWDQAFQYISKSREGKRARITVAPADIFTQLVLHEVHHRAQVMVMLRELAVPVQDIDYGYMTFAREVLG